MDALVVIDVQNGMFGDEKPHDGEAVVSRIQDMIRRARAAGPCAAAAHGRSSDTGTAGSAIRAPAGRA